MGSAGVSVAGGTGDCDSPRVGSRPAPLTTSGERKRGRRKVLDNRRSVFLMQRLSSEPRRRKVSRRKRGAP